ncbi:MAG: hypothetical protein KY459_00040 [Acidobacteria bacterium]|nr:hypothetical protein [Acidobacteriota bacterium]
MEWAASTPEPAEPSPRRAILVYGLLLILVIGCGVVALWALIERRRLDGAITPRPLPEITFVTTEPDDETTAAWVSLLSEASLSPRVVTPDDLAPAEGVIVLGSLEGASESEVQTIIDTISAKDQGTFLTGAIPPQLEADLDVATDTVQGSAAFAATPAASPILARVAVAYRFPHAEGLVPVIEERSKMGIDARWEESSRAAIAHWSDRGGRFVWLGFHPGSLADAKDAQLRILLRAAARWADRQPLSDGALLPPSGAPVFEPDLRRAAQNGGLAFSVEATEWPTIYGVRVWNRGDGILENPAVAMWLPDSEGKEATLWGSPIMNRFAEMVSQKDYYVLRLDSLNSGEERLFAVELE